MFPMDVSNSSSYLLGSSSKSIGCQTVGIKVTYFVLQKKMLMINQHGDNYNERYSSDAHVLRRIKWDGKEMLTFFLVSKVGNVIH